MSHEQRPHIDIGDELSSRTSMPDTITDSGRKGSNSKVTSAAGRGLFSVVWKAKDDHGRDLAVKLKARQDDKTKSY